MPLNQVIYIFIVLLSNEFQLLAPPKNRPYAKDKTVLMQYLKK